MICTVSLAMPASAAQPFIKKQHTRKAELKNADVYGKKEQKICKTFLSKQLIRKNTFTVSKKVQMVIHIL